MKPTLFSLNSDNFDCLLSTEKTVLNNANEHTYEKSDHVRFFYLDKRRAQTPVSISTHTHTFTWKVIVYPIINKQYYFTFHYAKHDVTLLHKIGEATYKAILITQRANFYIASSGFI